MPACSAYGCTNRPSKCIPGITFHRFPRNEQRRALWINAVRRQNWSPSACSVLCSKHFSEDMIDRTSVTTVRLRENAIPNVFNAIPSYHKKVCELHFKPSDIEVEASAYDPKTQRTITAPLGAKRLKKGSIPTLLIPSFRSSSSSLSKEDPEEKRIRKEKELLNLAVKQGLINVSDDVHQFENITNSSCDSTSLALSPTDVIENQQKKSSKMEKRSGIEMARELNSTCNSNSAQQTQLNSIQDVPQITNVTGSKINLSTFDASLPDIEIKKEKPWEEEYHFPNSVTNRSEENGNIMEAGKTTSENCDGTFYTKPLIIEKRDEIFGEFVSCEMSDLRKNPELYLRTQQSILKLLVEAHFELMSSS